MPDKGPFPAEDALILNTRAVKEFRRIFGIGRLGPEEASNAMIFIMKNLTKFKNKPLSDDWMRRHATNPPGRLLPPEARAGRTSR